MIYSKLVIKKGAADNLDSDRHPNNQTKGGCNNIITQPPDKKKGGLYYDDEHLFNKLRKVQRR